MKEIIWVMGHSGVGKETFCRSLSSNPDISLVKQLSWNGLKVGLCESSIAHVSRGCSIKKEDDRDKIIDELTEKADLLNVVLLKWQAVDTAKGRVNNVSSIFHEAIIRALVTTGR
jgi:ABC-type phosphate/phosphonate transport system ATPase subunit